MRPWLILAVAALALPARAPAATALGQAGAEVVTPITVTSLADLDFGVIATSGLSGTVTVQAEGGASFAGGAAGLCDGSSCAAPHPARFAVSGEANRTYVVAAPATIIVTGTPIGPGGGTAPDLVIGGLTVRAASRPGAGSGGMLDGQGADTFTVGGTLALPGQLPPARYRAVVPVVVTYG
ncbi:MAG: DUF4402 domain-containing protein [Proteobacteria bacterium]|nr:DUF4402 domain-containing protein [Pseudomonadota bacterium]